MLLLSDDFFQNKLFSSKHSFRNTIRVSNSLDPDQDRLSVGPDLGPDCFEKGYQQMPNIDANKERVKQIHKCNMLIKYL